MPLPKTLRFLGILRFNCQVIFKKFLDSFLHFVLPNRCALCKVSLLQSKGLCHECWQRLTFILPPYCAICGLPFNNIADNAAPLLSLCGSCTGQPPPFDKAYAALKYDKVSKQMILRYKYQDETALLPVLGDWLAMAGAALLDESDCITPVPLHWRRLFQRQYNQAGLLAQYLSKKRKIPARLLLKRVSFTGPQGRLSRAKRFKNIKGCFKIKEKEFIKGKNILLIDDVIASGSTVRECARMLKKAGANKVFVLAIAKVFEH